MKTIILLLALLGTARAATVLRIQCGGTGGTDAAGNAWAADASYTGGARWDAASQVAMAAQPVPYRSLRYGAAFSYTLPLAAGAYSITLKFLEPNKTGGGQRVFTVSVNSSQAIAGLDLYSVAGGLKPYDRTFAATSNGQIRLDFSATAGNAVLSAIQVDSIPEVVPPSNGITCESGTLAVGAELTADASSQEIEIMTDIPGNRRWEQVTVCTTDRFLGQSRVTASMGRPGSNNSEMTGAAVSLENSSGNVNCWSARPSPPQFIGPYSVVINVKAYTQDASNFEVPGNIRMLTSGTLTWEACGYQGKIGNLASGSKALDNVPLLQCSGAFSHIDPATGKTYTSDCAGLLWAQFRGLSMVGVPMTPAGAGTWTKLR